jgi:hypothetical protein
MFLREKLADSGAGRLVRSWLFGRRPSEPHWR